jgi:hypothetical protein
MEWLEGKYGPVIASEAKQSSPNAGSEQAAWLDCFAPFALHAMHAGLAMTELKPPCLLPTSRYISGHEH